jgi:antitoxin MazE
MEPLQRLIGSPQLGEHAGQIQPLVGQSRGCTKVADVATMWSRLYAVAVVRAKLVKIGNSRGVRLAKPLLEVAGLADEVEIEAAPGVLTIRPSAHPRAGWAEAASSFQPEGLIDEMSNTRFDEEEWSW